MNQNSKITIQLPANYTKKYLLDFLLQTKAASVAKSPREVGQDLLAVLDKNNLGMSERMLYYYRDETIVSTKKQLSQERLAIIAQFFDLDDPADLITKAA